jgi:hypothetical protein
MGCAGRHKYASSWPAANGAFAATQIKLPLKNVENLFNLGVVVRACIESRRNRELKQRALLGVFGCDQIINASLMQCYSVGLTVM